MSSYEEIYERAVKMKEELDNDPKATKRSLYEYVSFIREWEYIQSLFKNVRWVKKNESSSC